MIYAVRSMARSRRPGPVLKRLMLCVVVCLAVAGPWYLKNAGSAVKFAIFSAKYNELATGVLRTPLSQRAAEMANNLAGWPLIVTIAACAVATVLFRAAGSTARDAGGDQATAARRIPPGWRGWARASRPPFCCTRPTSTPGFCCRSGRSLAVAIGSGRQCASTRIPVDFEIDPGVGFAVSSSVARRPSLTEPLFPTYWKTTGLIDDLVNRYGVSNAGQRGQLPGLERLQDGADERAA